MMILRKAVSGFRHAALGLALCSIMLLAVGPASADSIRLTGSGASFPFPLYTTWFKAYHKAQPGVFIDYQAKGSGAGIKDFINHTVDFAASDAAMNDEEIARVDRGVKLIPATAGIIVLAYNLGNINGELRLPRQVYLDIFLGKIKNWSDPPITKANPGLNLTNRPIVRVTRQDASGTTFAFTNHLSTISEEWRNRGPGTGKLIDWPGNPMVGRGNEGVAGKIKISVGAIGYVEYGYADRAGLAMASLENKAGRFVRPRPNSCSETLANTAAQMPENMRLFIPDPTGENSYPIVTYSWLLLYLKYPDAKRAALLREFVEWGIKEGQQYSSELGYCPLPSRVVEKVRDAFDEIQR